MNYCNFLLDHWSGLSPPMQHEYYCQPNHVKEHFHWIIPIRTFNGFLPLRHQWCWLMNILHKPDMLWLLSVHSLTPQFIISSPLGSFHTVLQTSQIHCQTLYFLLLDSAQVVPFQKVLSIYSKS